MKVRPSALQSNCRFLAGIGFGGLSNIRTHTSYIIEDCVANISITHAQTELLYLFIYIILHSTHAINCVKIINYNYARSSLG